MRVRGKILRALSEDPGLLIVNGRQYRFSSAEWRSAAAPSPGMDVEAALDSSDRVTEIVMAPEGLIGRKPLARILEWLSAQGERNGGERRS